MALSEDIRALNLHFLLVLRDQSLRDTSAACLSFGVSPDFVQHICEMSLEKLHQFAVCDSLYFAPRFPASTIDKISRAPVQLRSAMVEVQSASAA